MMRRAYVVPILMVVVALIHVVRVVTLDQSVWQGAGFAMFVEYDSDVTRGVVAHTMVDGDVVPLDLEDLPDDLLLQARVTPGGPALQRIAMRLAADLPDGADEVVVEVRGPGRHPEGVQYRTIRRVEVDP